MRFAAMLLRITEERMNIMSFKDVIKSSILANFSGDLSLRRIIVVLLVALILGIYIFLVYKVAVNNEFYSKDFNRTLILMSVTTAAIVLAIQSNIVISLGMVGALSIVRFRTAVKSSLDLFFLFWAISVGIICGARLYVLGAILCVIVTIALFISEKIESPVKLNLLIVRCESADTANELMNKLSDKSVTNFLRLKNKTVSGTNGKKPSSTELIIEYKTKDEKALDAVLKEMSGITQYSYMNYDRETRI